jgi:hypothetical protein
MNAPQSSSPKSYFVKRGEHELGPFTLPQLNKMRSAGQLAADDPCRAADATEYKPLAVIFPHLADFARKSPEEHKQAARRMEGNVLANSALACGILSWFIAGPILSVFAIVLGAKSYLYAQRLNGLFGALIGVLAFMYSMARIFHFLPE